MAKHLVFNAWSKTACGLDEVESRNTTDQLAETTCKNCMRFVDSALPAHAWTQCKPTSLRRLYLERAGLEPVRVETIIRKKIWSAISKNEQKKVIRQMQSNPDLARLLVKPFKEIERGGPLDKRSDYPRISHIHPIKTASCCKNCGFPV